MFSEMFSENNVLWRKIYFDTAETLIKSVKAGVVLSAKWVFHLVDVSLSTVRLQLDLLSKFMPPPVSKSNLYPCVIQVLSSVFTLPHIS